MLCTVGFMLGSLVTHLKTQESYMKHNSIPQETDPPAFATTRFNNSYARLPGNFYARLNPVPVKRPALVRFNRGLAEELGLNVKALMDDKGVAVFAGNEIPTRAEPLAQAYAGHQFGQFVPQLGDGRAILLGEVFDKKGQRRDIQLKGSGQTPFSRRGDGRAALGPVIREYIVSEAMHALGVPTTRSLAAVTTGEPVFRETPLPGAILTRVAASHVRVGTFEYFAARRDVEALHTLANYVIDRHYPQAKDAANPYLALLQVVGDAQASLVAKWLHIGFIHGVMNTDNMAISGETIDYGPCAFMDAYDPATVFSSIDQWGRYAYGNQGNVAQWNLARFAETLLPLLDADGHKAVAMAEEVVASFQEIFSRYWLNGMRCKLGLLQHEDNDLSLIQNLLELMHKHIVDYTLSFRYLGDLVDEKADDANWRTLFSSDAKLDSWLARWRKRLQQENRSPDQIAKTMDNVNPAFIPRNHRVEKALAAAVEGGDFSKMDRLIVLLSKPYQDQLDFADYMNPPEPQERVYQTFCGT
jgi:uncharacterized protein YdiU (UPF0061 family)